MIASAFDAHDDGRKPTALWALAAEVMPQFPGLSFASRTVETMRSVAREAGLAHLIARVRRSLKDRYPITPIERYVTWTRQDGQPLDPWIKVHIRRGGEIDHGGGLAPTGSRTSGLRARPVLSARRDALVSLVPVDGASARYLS